MSRPTSLYGIIPSHADLDSRTISARPTGRGHHAALQLELVARSRDLEVAIVGQVLAGRYTGRSGDRRVLIMHLEGVPLGGRRHRRTRSAYDRS